MSKETAWQMLQRLTKNGIRFGKWEDLLPEKFHSEYTSTLSFIRFVTTCPEKEAIKVLSDIEEKLKNEK